MNNQFSHTAKKDLKQLDCLQSNYNSSVIQCNSITCGTFPLNPYSKNKTIGINKMETSKKYFTTKEDFLLAERMFNNLIANLNKINNSVNNIQSVSNELDIETLEKFELFSEKVRLMNDYAKLVKASEKTPVEYTGNLKLVA